jgi:hypothetical protein
MANFAIKIIFLLKPNTLYKITGLAMHCCLRRLQGWTWATGKEVILWPMAAAMTSSWPSLNATSSDPASLALISNDV